MGTAIGLIGRREHRRSSWAEISPSSGCPGLGFVCHDRARHGPPKGGGQHAHRDAASVVGVGLPRCPGSVTQQTHGPAQGPEDGSPFWSLTAQHTHPASWSPQHSAPHRGRPRGPRNEGRRGRPPERGNSHRLTRSRQPCAGAPGEHSRAERETDREGREGEREAIK